MHSKDESIKDSPIGRFKMDNQSMDDLITQLKPFLDEHLVVPQSNPNGLDYSITFLSALTSKLTSPPGLLIGKGTKHVRLLDGDAKKFNGTTDQMYEFDSDQSVQALCDIVQNTDPSRCSIRTIPF